MNVQSVDFLRGQNGREAQAIEHLRSEVSAGRRWADAVLETIGLWATPVEMHHGRRLTYLVRGEAFDWLLLAERLMVEISSVVAREEEERLLFDGELPLYVTDQQFRNALGPSKYRAYLNFFYGVVVEEALMLAVEQEARKDGQARGFIQGRHSEAVAALRLYGEEYGTLLRRFQREQGARTHLTLSIDDWKGFVYWLFKLRLQRSDGARTASDTRKGLRQLRAMGGRQQASDRTPNDVLIIR